jgi:hypothetical protein
MRPPSMLAVAAFRFGINMASDHNQLIGSALALHASHFGESVTYTSPAGVSSAVRYAIVMPEQIEKRRLADRLELVPTRELRVVIDTANEKYCGVAEWLPNAVVAVDSVNYRVERVEARNADGSHSIKLKRTETMEKTRKGFRVGRNA